jgi:hypothetical protein
MRVKLYPARRDSKEILDPFLYEFYKMVQQITLEVYYDIRTVPNPP